MVLVLVLVPVLVPDPRYVPPRISAATLPERGSLRCARRSQSSIQSSCLQLAMLLTFFCTCSSLQLGMLFCSSARVGLFSPAVGPLFSTRCGSALFTRCGSALFYPLWVRSFLPAVGPLFSTRCGSALLVSFLRYHPIWPSLPKLLRLQLSWSCVAFLRLRTLFHVLRVDLVVSLTPPFRALRV